MIKVVQKSPEYPWQKPSHSLCCTFISFHLLFLVSGTHLVSFNIMIMNIETKYLDWGHDYGILFVLCCSPQCLKAEEYYFKIFDIQSAQSLLIASLVSESKVLINKSRRSFLMIWMLAQGQSLKRLRMHWTCSVWSVLYNLLSQNL